MTMTDNDNLPDWDVGPDPAGKDPGRLARYAAGRVGWLGRGSAVPDGPVGRVGDRRMRRVRCMAVSFDG